MKFSVLLPQTNQVASAEAMLETAIAAERLGFDAISVHDHIVFDGWFVISGSAAPDQAGERRTLFEPFASLAYVAARTTKLRLLTSIIALPLREPILFAKQASTLDVLSNGRLVLGVGVGPPKRQGGPVHEGDRNPQAEYAALEVAGHRGNRLDEFIRAADAIWTQDRSTYLGEVVRFEGIEVFPKPRQSPRPPVWIGGRSRAAVHRAATLGDAWSPSQIGVGDYRAGLDALGSIRLGLGRPMPTEYPVHLFVCIAPSDAAAEKKARNALRSLYPEVGEFRDRTIVGGASTFVARLRQYREAGADFVNMYPVYGDVHDLIDQMHQIAAEVMPHV